MGQGGGQGGEMGVGNRAVWEQQRVHSTFYLTTGLIWGGRQCGSNKEPFAALLKPNNWSDLAGDEGVGGGVGGVGQGGGQRGGDVGGAPLFCSTF